MLGSRLLVSAALAAYLIGAWAGAARANGRAPAVVSIHPRPGSEDLVLWSTWGLLVARGEPRFRWMCENALKIGGSFDPDVVVTADGTIFSTSFEGLLVTTDGCVFGTTGLGSRYVARLTRGKDGALFAATADGDDNAIYKSTDGGATFPQRTVVGMIGDWWTSLVVAPSDAAHVYLTGYRINLATSTKTQLMFRSTDGGVTFLPLPLPQTGTGLATDIVIAGVGPTNPALVFARVSYARGDATVGDRLYRSMDGGANWAEVLTADAAITGFVLRRDGSAEVATVASGRWHAAPATGAFTAAASNLRVACMIEREDGALLACGQNFAPDFMAVGRSTDAVSWTKVFEFTDAAGPVDCPVGTAQCEVCQLQTWCGIREQFGIPADPTSCDVDGPDGTLCGGPLPPVEPSGCCDAGTPAGQQAALLWLLALALAWWRWPRRARGPGPGYRTSS